LPVANSLRFAVRSVSRGIAKPFAVPTIQHKVQRTRVKLKLSANFTPNACRRGDPVSARVMRELSALLLFPRKRSDWRNHSGIAIFAICVSRRRGRSNHRPLLYFLLSVRLQA